jgi:hypothetical protein
MRAIKEHPGVFVTGGVVFLLVEHWLMHRGGLSKVSGGRAGQS